MAKITPSPSPSLLLCLFLGALLFLAQFAAAARRAAPKEETAAAAKPDKKEKDNLSIVQEGTVMIPGVGRYRIGSRVQPRLRGLDHSGPAAAHARFLPGGDDTFVPNPGFEFPNPFRRVIP